MLAVAYMVWLNIFMSEAAKQNGAVSTQPAVNEKTAEDISLTDMLGSLNTETAKAERESVKPEKQTTVSQDKVSQNKPEKPEKEEKKQKKEDKKQKKKEVKAEKKPNSAILSRENYEREHAEDTSVRDSVLKDLVNVSSGGDVRFEDEIESSVGISYQGVIMLGNHSYSTYSLSGNYVRFTSYIGCASGVNKDEVIDFKIRLDDDRENETIIVLPGKKRPQFVDLDVTGADSITFLLDSAGPSDNKDYGVFIVGGMAFTDHTEDKR